MGVDDFELPQSGMPGLDLPVSDVTDEDGLWRRTVRVLEGLNLWQILDRLLLLLLFIIGILVVLGKLSCTI